MASFSSNEPVGGLTGQQLGWSLWWVNHRVQVIRLGFGVFIAFDALLLGAGLWGFTDWLAIGGIKEEQAIRMMTRADYGQVPGVTLEEVQIAAPVVLQGAKGKIDVLIPVENRNARFWAGLRYRLIVGGVEQPIKDAFVLPNQAKYLSELGISAENGSSVELKVERRVWHRALTGGIDQQAFADARLKVAAENAVFKPSDPLATAPVASAAFTLTNDSAFGYYDVGLLTLLFRGEAVVGANRVTVDRLLPGERKPMEIFWYQSLPQVTKVEVIPEINIYDPDVYRAPGA